MENICSSKIMTNFQNVQSIVFKRKIREVWFLLWWWLFLMQNFNQDTVKLRAAKCSQITGFFSPFTSYIIWVN